MKLQEGFKQKRLRTIFFGPHSCASGFEGTIAFFVLQLPLRDSRKPTASPDSWGVGEWSRLICNTEPQTFAFFCQSIQAEITVGQGKGQLFVKRFFFSFAQSKS